jgi:hypothetical protein
MLHFYYQVIAPLLKPYRANTLQAGFIKKVARVPLSPVNHFTYIKRNTHCPHFFGKL